MEDNYEIKVYQPSQKSSWDTFVKSAKNATFLFQRDFMDYHSDRFKDFSLLVYQDKKLVAVLPANISGSEMYSHQGLSYGGLVLGNKITFEETLPIFKSLLTFLKSKNIAILNLKLLPKIYNQLPSDEIDYLLFLVKASIIRRDITSCVFNDKPLKITSSNRLRGIKKGIKNQLQICEEPDFKSFWMEVLEPNLKQIHNQKPVHALEEIELLQTRFPKN